MSGRNAVPAVGSTFQKERGQKGGGENKEGRRRDAGNRRTLGRCRMIQNRPVNDLSREKTGRADFLRTREGGKTQQGRSEELVLTLIILVHSRSVLQKVG